MAVKVTKRQTAEGPRYSITGLTFEQLFRVKKAMFEHEEHLREIAKDVPPSAKEDFEGFAQDAHEVANAVRNGCV